MILKELNKQINQAKQKINKLYTKTETIRNKHYILSEKELKPLYNKIEEWLDLENVLLAERKKRNEQNKKKKAKAAKKAKRS